MMPDPIARGSFRFDAIPGGDLANTAANVERLRKLWLDRSVINGNDLGPGDPGDFDNGAWHVACHLVGASGVRLSTEGRPLWLEISHDAVADSYFASVTVADGGRARTLRLDSAEGRWLLERSSLLGFVEGHSLGRTSARGVEDPPTLFNLWRRQDFDHPVGSPSDGGKVWEHWCTLRDIRPSARIGTAVLTAYITLAAALGDRFSATVARGRREYGHPTQLAILTLTGFTTSTAATWDTTPLPIPAKVEHLLQESRPSSALRAVAKLNWSNPPRYYMFERAIKKWSHATDVHLDLQRVDATPLRGGHGTESRAG